MSIGVAVHDRRDGVEEGQRILAGDLADGLASTGEVSGPVATITLSHSGGGSAISSRTISIKGWVVSAWVMAAEKPSRSTAKRAAGWNLVGIGCPHHQGVQPPHLLMQQADGVVLAVVGT